METGRKYEQKKKQQQNVIVFLRHAPQVKLILRKSYSDEMDTLVLELLFSCFIFVSNQ